MLTALDVLGYERPTKLRGERARLVGLVLPELQNPIFPAFAEVVSGALAQQGYTPVLCTQTVGGVSEEDYVDLLLQQQVSGVIFAGGLYAQAAAPHGHYRRLAERGLPTVLMNAGIDGLGFPRVSCDDAVAVEQAMGHLISLGHTRIGLLLGPPDHIPSRRKLERGRQVAAGGRAQARARGRRPRAVLARGGPGRDDAAARPGITGIVCASDPMALGAIRAVRRAGYSVPGDVSVVGFDDSFLMNCTEPPLTTVRQPIEPMGRMAIELLNGLIGGTSISQDEMLFEPELVVRNSTGPVPDPR